MKRKNNNNEPYNFEEHESKNAECSNGIKIRNLDEAQLITDKPEETLIEESLIFAENVSLHIDVSAFLGLKNKRYFFAIESVRRENIKYIDFLNPGEYKIKLQLSHENTNGFHEEALGTVSIKSFYDESYFIPEPIQTYFDREDKLNLLKSVQIIEAKRKKLFSMTNEAQYLKLIYEENSERAYKIFYEKNIRGYELLTFLELQNLIVFSDVEKYSAYENIRETVCRITERGFDMIQEISKEKIDRRNKLYIVTDNTE